MPGPRWRGGESAADYAESSRERWPRLWRRIGTRQRLPLLPLQPQCCWPSACSGGDGSTAARRQATGRPPRRSCSTKQNGATAAESTAESTAEAEAEGTPEAAAEGTAAEGTAATAPLCFLLQLRCTFCFLLQQQGRAEQRAGAPRRVSGPPAARSASCCGSRKQSGALSSGPLTRGALGRRRAQLVDRLALQCREPAPPKTRDLLLVRRRFENTGPGGVRRTLPAAHPTRWPGQGRPPRCQWQDRGCCCPVAWSGGGGDGSTAARRQATGSHPRRRLQQEAAAMATQHREGAGAGASGGEDMVGWPCPRGRPGGARGAAGKPGRGR